MTNANKRFAGRAEIVTGATRGIGRAIALELVRRGADVTFNYAKSAEAAGTLKGEIEAMGVRELSTSCDVAQTDAVAETVKQTKDAFGRIDFLVNNAGITRDTLILLMKEDDWDTVIDTNLTRTFEIFKGLDNKRIFYSDEQRRESRHTKTRGLLLRTAFQQLNLTLWFNDLDLKLRVSLRAYSSVRRAWLKDTEWDSRGLVYAVFADYISDGERTLLDKRDSNDFLSLRGFS